MDAATPSSPSSFHRRDVHNVTPSLIPSTMLRLAMSSPMYLNSRPSSPSFSGSVPSAVIRPVASVKKSVLFINLPLGMSSGYPAQNQESYRILVQERTHNLCYTKRFLLSDDKYISYLSTWRLTATKIHPDTNVQPGKPSLHYILCLGLFHTFNYVVTNAKLLFFLISCVIVHNADLLTCNTRNSHPMNTYDFVLQNQNSYHHCYAF